MKEREGYVASVTGSSMLACHVAFSSRQLAPEDSGEMLNPVRETAATTAALEQAIHLLRMERRSRASPAVLPRNFLVAAHAYLTVTAEYNPQPAA